MTAEIEKVIVHAHPFDAQKLLPHGRDCFFDRCPRRNDSRLHQHWNVFRILVDTP